MTFVERGARPTWACEVGGERVMAPLETPATSSR